MYRTVRPETGPNHTYSVGTDVSASSSMRRKRKGSSLLVGLFAFLFVFVLSDVSAQIALPYSESFSSIAAANGFPTVSGGAWTRTGTATTQPTYITNQATYNRVGHNDTKFMSFRYNSGSNVYAVGPFNLTAGSTYQVGSWYITDGLGGWTTFKLTYGTGTTTALQTNTIASVNAATNTSYQQLQGTFTPATSGSYYLGIYMTSTSAPWYFSVDDFTIEELLPCTGDPSAGTVSVPNTAVCSGATVTFTSTGFTSAGGISYQWQSSTDGVNYTNISGATSTSYTTTISTGAYYQLAVTCSNSGSTVLSNAVQMTINPPTQCYCQPVTTYGCTDGDVIARVILNTLDNNSGTGCPGGTTGYSNYTTDPLLTTTLLPSSTYNCVVYAGQWTEGYAAWIDYNDNGVFETTERIGYSNGQVAGSGSVGVLGSSASFPIVIDCNPPAGVHRLRVRAMYNTNGVSVDPCVNNSYGEIEDYLITIAAAPLCPSPGALTVTGVTDNSANLQWTLGCSTATNYDFEYGPVGFTPGTGTMLTNVAATINGSIGTYTLTGLASETAYDVYYRANCGAEVSAWSTAAYVFTGYCQPSYTSSNYWISQVSASSNAGSFNNSTGFATNGYGDFSSSIAIQAFAGNNVALTVNGSVTGYYYYSRVWVDWNNDLDFADAGELMYSTPTYTYLTPYSTSIAVPVGQAPGNYRMRIRYDYGDSYYTAVLDPCGTRTIGETEDYTLNVIPMPAAPTISMVTPMQACPNSQVTITGTDFIAVSGVNFGAISANYTVVSSTEIVATVPTGLTAGLNSIDVTTISGTATYGLLTYPDPVTSISGTQGICGATPASMTASGTGSFSWTVADGCTYSISLMDTYGDGWNGGQIDVLVDGVLVYDNITLAAGTGPEYHDFSVYAGSTIVINQVALGSFIGEQHYTIYSGSAGTGSVVYASPNGIPATHTEIATLCGSTPMGTTSVGSSASLDASTPGLYTVQFTDLNGCITTASAVVAPHEVPVVSTPSQVTACEGGTVDITAVETTGLTGVSYTWYNQQGNVVGTSASITTPTMFTDDYYSVTASTIYCVSDTAYTGIVVSQLSGIVLTPINVSCYGYADGSFTQTELCGTAPYQYSVVTAGNPVGTYGALPTNLTAGNYEVYVKDANGNESLPIPLTIASPAAITATVTTTGAEICSGLTVGNVQAVVGTGSTGGSFGTNLQSPGPATTFGPITVNVPAGATIASMSLVLTNIQSYYWNEMLVSLNGGVTLPTQTISTYGSGNIASITVNIPAVNYTGGPVNLVLSESYDDFGIDATFGNVVLNVTYTYPQNIMWFANAAGTNLLGFGSTFNVVGSSVCASPATSGIYTVYAAYTDGSCVGATAPAVLNVSGLSGVALTPINLSCFESNDGSFTQTELCGTAPYTYSVVASGAAAGSYGSLPTNLAAGSYDVFIHDANGEAAGPIALTITQPALLPTTVTTDGTACIGAAVGEVSALAQFVGTISAASGSVNLPVISNGGVVTNAIAVSSIPVGSVLTGIEVNMNMTHTWDSDVNISLTAPNGTTIDLSSGNGGSGDNYLNTTFSSYSNNSITNGTAPFSGTFAPEGNLSTLFGNTNGNWTLSVVDNVGGDDGNLQNWTISFTYLQPGDVIWFADAAGSQFIGTGATLNVVGTSALPTATQGVYTVYAASFDGNCHGLLVPATLSVGQPLIPTLTAVVVGTQNPVLAANYDMTGLSSATVSSTLTFPAGSVITSAQLHLDNVTVQGFSTDADVLVSVSGAASMNQLPLGSSFTNLSGASFTFPISVDPNGGNVDVNFLNNQGWWGDQVSFGSIYLTVSYYAPTQEVICPDATVQLAVTTVGGGGPQSYVWYNNGTPISGATSSTYTALVVEGDSYTVGVSDDCNTNVLSSAYTPVYATNNVVTISGPSTILINDITSATPGIGTYTLNGEVTNAVINWYFSDSSTGPWNPLANNASDTVMIDFAGANGVYYFSAEVVYPAGCTSWSNALMVDVANAIDFPCFAAELTVGDQNGFVWNTASATVDANEVAPPADGCNVQTGWCESTLDATVWFKFVAPASGHVGIQAPGFDDQLAVYSVGNCFDYSTFTLINANDDDGSGVGAGQMYSALLSDVKCLTPGETYYVQLDAFSGTGETTMILVDLGNQAPTITDVPLDMTVSNDADVCGAVVWWDFPTITDDQGCFDYSVDQVNGSVFPIGTTTVTITAFDLQGDSTVYSFNITVNDTQMPVMACLADVTVMVGVNECSYPSSNLDFPEASDNCGIASVTSNLDAVLYPGTYYVVYTATDVNGNATVCNRVVTVTENPNTVWPTELTVDGDGTFCAGSSIGIHASAGNYTYQWVYNNNLLPLETGASIDALQSGVYFCILTNEFGCQTTTNAVTVTSLPNVDYYLDADGDGYGAGAAVSTCTGAPAGYVANNTDCNDADALINPAAAEILDNNVDENCDGVIEIGVAEVAGSVLNAYPNPTAGHITLNVSSDLMGETYRIYDGVGKVVAAGRVSAANQELELGGLSAGTYMLSIRESHVRIVIQH